MQHNNTNNNILNDVKNTQEYEINKAIYNVNRYFNNEKSIKDIILGKITVEKSLMLN